MINTFKLKPTLDGKRGNRKLSDVPPKHHQHDHLDDHDNFESEIERDSREYTNFSMYNTDDEGMAVNKTDMIQFERSDSSTKSKKKIFQHSVHKVIKLQALVQKLKSFNSKLVKTTLIEMVPLINNPETAVILKDAGLCTLLLDLLKFDPLSHWSIVGLSLQALLSIVGIPECAQTVITLPTFPSTIELFLKSDKALPQKIAGRIVHRCFVQPIQDEWIVLNDKNMLGLLFKAMELPYKDVQLNLLNLLEDLTYHCDNTLLLCAYAETVEIDFIHMIVDIVLAEGHSDIRLLAMKIYLNALSAVHFDRRIERAVILHSLTVETSLMKHMQSLQRAKLRKTSALAGGTSRSSRMFMLSDRGSSRDITTPDMERPQLSTRRSSMIRFKSQKYGDLDEEAKKARQFGGELLQVTEEISVIAEILWLIRSSVMFQRLVKHTKRTNLVKPHDSISQLLTTA